MTTQTLINNLLKAEAFDHPVKKIRLLETHISWIILTGEFAYKIKKPVDFEFLNYTTLEKRQFFCNEEIRLNQLLAPEIYLEVVTINGDENNPKINGDGSIVDYAVKMREFNQEKLFTHLLEQNTLTPQLIDQLAQQIAEFHKRTPVADKDSRFGTPEHVHEPVIQNFQQIREFLTDENDIALLDQVEQWAGQQYHQWHHLLLQRKRFGFIREIHGDLHLGNIILFHGKPLIFDCIEFNDDFRWRDVLGDVAFLIMDLMDRKQIVLARHLLNNYLLNSGDYAGVPLLPYHLSYRAVIRAKVALFCLYNEGLTEEEKQFIWQKYRNTMQLAYSFMQMQKPCLIVTKGLVGSGKSTVARYLVEHMQAIQICSDVERKRLFNLQHDARTQSPLNEGIYLPEMTNTTYLRLKNIAKDILSAGYSAIVDATFLQKAQREVFQQLAHDMNVPFAIVECQADEAILQQRIQARQAEKRDPSEARLDILQWQKQHQEKLSSEEKAITIFVDSENFSGEEFVKQVAKILFGID